MRGGVLGFLLLAACGASGAVSAAHEAGAPDAGAAAMSVADAASEPPASLTEAAGAQVDAGGTDAPADSVAWAPTLHACSIGPTGFMQLPPPPAGPSLQSCPGSDQVVISNPQMVMQEAGLVPPGATTTVSVLVTSPSTPCLEYACIALSADNPGVSFTGGGPELYCVNTPAGMTFSSYVTFASSIVAGTHVRFAAWLVWVNATTFDGATPASCASSALEWEAVVGG
jgi:hypothetical protein